MTVATSKKRKKSKVIVGDHHKLVFDKKDKTDYCNCGGSPCILRESGLCAWCKKPIRAGVYY